MWLLSWAKGAGQTQKYVMERENIWRGHFKAQEWHRSTLIQSNCKEEILLCWLFRGRGLVIVLYPGICFLLWVSPSSVWFLSYCSDQERFQLDRDERASLAARAKDELQLVHEVKEFCAGQSSCFRAMRSRSHRLSQQQLVLLHLL